MDQKDSHQAGAGSESGGMAWDQLFRAEMIAQALWAVVFGAGTIAAIMLLGSK
ncbi:MAG: hypothetical protein ACN6O3_00590 [Comamonas sp.]